jgi:fucose 4-O-acetylase-like acetyltransferase
MIKTFSDINPEDEKKLISFLQVYGIILVVFGHSFTSESAVFLNRFIYSFHMPLFVFISGYLFSNSALKKLKKSQPDNFLGKNGFLGKKAIRLLIPYLVISSFVFIPKTYFSSFSIRPVDLSLSTYIEMLIYPGKNVIVFFWFLPTIFIISILTFFLWKYLLAKAELKGWLICLLLFFGLSLFNPIVNVRIFNLSGVIHYFFFFLVGMAFYKYETEICCILTSNSAIKLILLLVVHLLIVYIFIDHPAYTKIILPVALLGIAESIIIGRIYLTRGFSFLDHLNGSTYTIYLFSWFPQVFIQFFILKFISIPWYISSIVSTLFGIYIPLLIFLFLNYIKNINRSGKFISVLLGN